MRTGLNFGFLQRLMTTPGLVDEYMLRLEQCHLDTVRVPLHWRRLVDDRGVSIGRGEVGDNYDRFFELLPADLRVLGLIVAPPRSVAVRHFRGVESVTDPYVRFLRAVVDRFERVDEIELWNEPNASDFYLSVADGSSHRPWTSDEFVDQVVLPGVELLHSHRPDMPLCLATFAENGLVGHDYLPGAPSGVLPRNARFEAMRDAEEGDRGRWHFVPSFGPRAIERIAAEVEVRPGDAIALHPYPYFEPGQDQTYAGRTLQLIDDAAEYLAPMRDKGVELWLTEVGCRAHDPRASNRKKLGDQASFVDRVFDAVPSLGVDRVYWYKFDDAPADLVQEKTFGLFDHFGRPRPSYRSFRSLSRSQVEGGPRTVVVTGDDLEHRADIDIEQDSERGFIDGSLDDTTRGSVVFPGRDHGAGIDATAAPAISFGRDVLLCAQLLPIGRPTPGSVRLALVDGGSVALSVELVFESASGWTVCSGSADSSVATMAVAADAGQLDGFGIAQIDDSIALLAFVGGELLSKPMAKPVDVSGVALQLRIRFENHGGGGSMWELRRFVASSDSSSPLWPHLDDM